jgi:hypothetical protein
MIRQLSTAIVRCVVLCLMPTAAAAQIGGAATADLTASQTSQGPMVVERVHNGFLFAPDFKITEVDHKTSGLVGGYAGVVFADAFFIGGGGYGLVTDTHGREMFYGGMVLQWFGRTNETFGYGAKMLMGGGTSESTDVVRMVDRGRVSNQTVQYRQDFYVLEPEVTALVRVTKNLRLSAGAGYRFTGSGWYDHYDYYPSGPGHSGSSGWVGSIGLQIGGGS